MIETTIEEAFGPINQVEERNAPERVLLSGNAGLLKHGRRVAVLCPRKRPVGREQNVRNIAELVGKHRLTVVASVATICEVQFASSPTETARHSIAVLGDPLDLFHPAKHRRMTREIGRRVLVIRPMSSEPETDSIRKRMENHCKALFADAVILVGNPDNRDSIETAWEALRLGRPLFLVGIDEPELFIDQLSLLTEFGAHSASWDDLGDRLFEQLPEVSRAEHAAFTFDD